jgi:hypothetical protein
MGIRRQLGEMRRVRRDFCENKRVRRVRDIRRLEWGGGWEQKIGRCNGSER